MDSTESLSPIKEELGRFPEMVVKEYRRAAPLVASRLQGEAFHLWAEEGVALAKDSFRSWEAAAEYFRVTPRVLDHLPFPYLLVWARYGRKLAERSFLLSSAYFQASPQALSFLSPHQIGEWGKLGLNLYKETWRSGSISCSFLKASSRLLQYLPFDELEEFFHFVEALAEKSYEFATECLRVSEEVLPEIERKDRKRFLELACHLAQANGRDALAYFKVGAKVLGRVERGERERFLSLADKISREEERHTLPFFLDCSQALSQVDRAAHPQLMRLAEELFAISGSATIEFLKSSPQVMARVKGLNLEHWLREGTQILKENREGGLAYFRLESARGEEVLERLSSGIELGQAKEILERYCQALTGMDVQVLPAKNLAERGIGWVSVERATTEGSNVYLPSSAEKYPAKEENFAWYKVLSTHQTAHLEFGSFTFSFEKEATYFRNWRQKLGKPKESDATPLQRFFDLFSDRRLASDLFTVVEDNRVDHQVKQSYRGIRRVYQQVQGEALEERAPLSSLTQRQALIEVLLRASLGETRATLPRALRPLVRTACRILKEVQSPEATVEDSAEATIRLYALLSRIPNIPLPPEEWETMDLLGEEDLSTESPEEDLWSEISDLESGPEALSYASPQEVEFRGDFKPELVQLLLKLKQSQSKEGLSSLSPEMLKELLEKSVEIEVSQFSPAEPSADLLSNLFKEMGLSQRTASSFIPDQRVDNSIGLDGEPLEKRGPLCFLYDEWDFRANDYKPDWCCVQQKTLEEGTPAFFESTLQNYYSLVNQIKRQFELLRPELLRKIKKLYDGEGLDFDAVIQAMVEKKAGQSPTEKIYWRRNKVQRDVAVVFLLDMSASTAEAIEEDRETAPDRDRDLALGRSLLWPRFIPPGEGLRPYKRIIDIEKESTVLLITALETIGDTYGIYGFSGYGRENVEFYIIKDIDEGFSDQVKGRIDKITPMRATRMGPAVRHSITKLEGREARTKILILLSDGRPQDQGYSRDGVEKEYAVHDTKKALLEAKQKAIIPFCLTVDKGGHDYLKTMCSDIGYEVVSDIRTLPKQLPALYKRLVG